MSDSAPWTDDVETMRVIAESDNDRPVLMVNLNKYRPAEIGMSLEDVDTPALLLDLDAFEFNIQLMAGFAEKFKINQF